jgi:hypothetical protein
MLFNFKRKHDWLLNIKILVTLCHIISLSYKHIYYYFILALKFFSKWSERFCWLIFVSRQRRPCSKPVQIRGFNPSRYDNCECYLSQSLDHIDLQHLFNCLDICIVRKNYCIYYWHTGKIWKSSYGTCNSGTSVRLPNVKQILYCD